MLDKRPIRPMPQFIHAGRSTSSNTAKRVKRQACGVCAIGTMRDRLGNADGALLSDTLGSERRGVVTSARYKIAMLRRGGRCT